MKFNLFNIRLFLFLIALNFYSVSQGAETNKIGIGLIGMGAHMTEKLIPALDSDKFSFNYGCRRNIEQLRKQQEEFNISEITTDFLDVINSNNVQAIIVAGAPDNLHIPVVKAALSHKIHVFVEKPLSLSPQMIEEIALQAKESPVVSMVGFNMTHTPTTNLLKEGFSRGSLSDIHIMCSLGTKPQENEHFLQSFNNSYYFSFIHAVSVLHKIMGTPNDIQVTAKKIDECRNGYIFDAICKDKKNQTVILSFQNAVTPSGFNFSVEYKTNEGILKTVDLKKNNEKTESYKIQMDDFYNCIKDARKPENNLESNAEIHSIMERIKAEVIFQLNEYF